MREVLVKKKYLHVKNKQELNFKMSTASEMAVSNGCGYNTGNLDISAGRSCTVNKAALLSISTFFCVIM